MTWAMPPSYMVAKILAGTAYDLICGKDLMDRIKEDFQKELTKRQ